MSMLKQQRYRVRVMRKVEDWVEVLALDQNQAEQEAVKMPHVLSVFSKSAIRADRPIMNNVVPSGIMEDDDDN